MTTVLVVDDSAVDRRLIGELLERRFQCSVDYAANGVEALAKMKGTSPDLVVTDLTMPVMDGLELVRSMRTHHVSVPVILMTAFGNESLAIDALRQGAASYVPKSQVGERLLDTIEEVLTLTRAGRGHDRLINCLAKTEFDFVLDNDPALIDPLVDLVQQMVSGMNFVDFTGRLQIGVALKEAILNALFHGSLEITPQHMEEMEQTLLEESDQSLVEKRGSELPYSDRRIYVKVTLSKDEARFIVRDQGPGFDVSKVPDLSSPGALEPEGRRGLSLIRTFMDEVTFNDAGTEVRMVKLASKPSP
jgi:CheY-like chemotaxis protein